VSLGLAAELRTRLARSAARPEAAAVSAGLALRLRFQVGDEGCDLAVADGSLRCEAAQGAADLCIHAPQRAWATALAEVPPPGSNSFAAWSLRNPDFRVEGEPLQVAQARALLEVLVEGLRPGIDQEPVGSPPDLSAIRGGYHRVRTADGDSCDVYLEAAGAGPPLLCLHTAGADARQFHPQLADPALAAQWRLLAFDLPSHGRSLPPQGWNGERYRQTQRQYLQWCVAVIEQVVREPVVVMGGSMGAAAALALAAERPDLVRGVVALEPPVRPRGRRNAFLTHAAVNGGWHSAAYVRGLMSPTSPLRQRRIAAWIYSQGAPGVYDGDLMFYSDEFDGEAVARRLPGERIPVHLLVGHYDFSATVADSHALAGWIAGAQVHEMPDLGHFPMIENPAAVRPYLVRALEAIRTRAVSPTS